MNKLSIFLISPKSFLLTSIVVMDNSVGCIKDLLCRSVVLLKLDNCSIRIYLLEIKDISDVGASESIDTLVIITYNAEVAVFVCQESDELKLCIVGILILIHHDIAESLLIRIKNLRTSLEELNSLHDKIIKVHGVVLLESCLIFCICLGNLDLDKVILSCKSIFLR